MLDRLCFKIISHLFSKMSHGRLTMTLPDHRQVYFGSTKSLEAQINVRRMRFFRRCVLNGAVGFGEAYVDGDWDTDDIVKVIRWMMLNKDSHPTLTFEKVKRSPVNYLFFINHLRHLLRINTLRGSRKNIEDHYDLGNDFFELFLDPTLTYSSAYFKTSQDSLKVAQIQKYSELCRKLRIQSHDYVLEIGSGWGGFAVYAAKSFGCRVTTITISPKQYAYAKARIKEEGLEDKIDIELRDYRHMTGKFDKIVSIEMIEAVGEKYYEAFFKAMHRLLKKDGLLGLQMILFPESRYKFSRKNVDWIQKHIFPGSLLPSLNTLDKAMIKTGTLGLFDYEDITHFYSRTLRMWREAFNQNVNKVKALEKDESFIRKWNYYFSYCEAAFYMRYIQVAQAIYTRPDNPTLMNNLGTGHILNERESLKHPDKELNINE